MRHTVFVLAAALVLGACSGGGAAGAGDAPAPAPSSASDAAAAAPLDLTGNWRTQFSISGRGAYTGQMIITPRGEVINAQLTITSPVQFESTLNGTYRNGQLELSGNFTAANGCQSSIRITCRGNASPLRGRVEIEDRCTSPLSGSSILSR